MRRRNFMQLLAAATATPKLWASSAQDATAPPATAAASSPGASGFNKYTEDYAHFCATPESERVFYTLRNGQIVAERLDPKSWKASSWGNPPDLPVPGGSHDGVPMESPIAGLSGQGPYQPTWESLLQYECPEWYRDAKFGIWNHWSPQCVPEDSDWYARNMYIEGQPQHAYQLQHYGPPSRFGYKDLCAQWTLLNWNPAELMDLYASTGAKFFVALANHHDGFDTWASKHHPWNAANIGPHRDVIGGWAAEARKHNLRFGVTIHQARNWWWFQPSHGAASSGAQAGVPYDGELTAAEGKRQWWEGLDPQQLYGVKHPIEALPDISFVKNFYDRTRDVIEQHNPDLLYFDNALFPLGWGGMNAGAFFYNHNLRVNGGRMEGVINVKNVPPKWTKAVVADVERGLSSEILPHPWQSETCIGEWHYNRALFNKPGEYGGYLPPRAVIHWMADTVSKNGTFILNIPGKPDGTIDRKERLILEKVGQWFKVNGEAIFATRPWKTFGEGPNMIKAGSFQGGSVKKLGPADVRYTRNKANTIVYAIALGWPEQALVLKAFAGGPRVTHVELIGSQEKVHWHQNAHGLTIQPPRQKLATDEAVAFRVRLS